jgi:hypothetical protein
VTSEALNLAALDAAVRQHNEGCDGQLVAIQMAQFEIDRLGWENFRGIPLEPDETMGTGYFRLVCDLEHDTSRQLETTDARGEPVPAGGER